MVNIYNSVYNYFLLGNVWSVGFGLDVSEFDVWWAIERKAREKAVHGKFRAYFDEEADKDTAGKLLLEAMDAEYIAVPVVDKNYEAHYEAIVLDLKSVFDR